MKTQALIAEFIGTFALIFVGILVLAHLGEADQHLGLVGVAFAHGLAIACMASATGGISGGHLNPAVSFGLFLAKKINVATFLTYVVAQILGAIVAAFAAKFCAAGDSMQTILHGTPALGKSITPAQGMVAEFITTFFLVFVVYGTAVDKRAPKMGALFIGLTVVLDILAIGPITGGAMNPARYFGPAIASGQFNDAAVYLVGPLLGGAAAALLFKYVLEEKEK